MIARHDARTVGLGIFLRGKSAQRFILASNYGRNVHQVAAMRQRASGLIKANIHGMRVLRHDPQQCQRGCLVIWMRLMRVGAQDNVGSMRLHRIAQALHQGL